MVINVKKPGPNFLPVPLLPNVGAKPLHPATAA